MRNILIISWILAFSNSFGQSKFENIINKFFISGQIGWFFQHNSYSNEGRYHKTPDFVFSGISHNKLSLGYMLNSRFSINIGYSKLGYYAYDNYPKNTPFNGGTDGPEYHNFILGGRYYMINKDNSRRFRISTGVDVMLLSYNQYGGNGKSGYGSFFENGSDMNGLADTIKYFQIYQTNESVIIPKLGLDLCFEYLFLPNVSIGYVAGFVLGFNSVMKIDTHFESKALNYNSIMNIDGNAMFQHLKLTIYFQRQFKKRSVFQDFQFAPL